jgi:hypothetical protein
VWIIKQSSLMAIKLRLKIKIGHIFLVKYQYIKKINLRSKF